MTDELDLVKLREWLAVVEVDRNTLDIEGLGMWNAAHLQLDLRSPALARRVLSLSEENASLRAELAASRQTAGLTAEALPGRRY